MYTDGGVHPNEAGHQYFYELVGARLWSKIVASRNDYNNLPIEMRNSPNNCVIDGFAIKVTLNDVYQGLYTWNIPKDKWMFNMDETNSNHMQELSMFLSIPFIDTFSHCGVNLLTELIIQQMKYTLMMKVKN